MVSALACQVIGPLAPADLAFDAALDSSLFDGLTGVTSALHVCRGNGPAGAWHSAGGYGAVSAILFPRLTVDRLLLEYDSERSGGFEPLRFVPKGKIVVLGLVTTKLNKLETSDELRQRIDEAAKFLPLEQMCLSPQCGFSSTVHGNDVAVEMQGKKLKLVVDTARAVWGDS